MRAFHPREADFCAGIGRIELLPVYICKSFGSIPPKNFVDKLSTKTLTCPHANHDNTGNYTILWTTLYLALPVIVLY